MASWFTHKSYFTAACLTLLLSGGCTDETPRYRGTEGATGKVVTVSLQVSLPPALEPTTKAADSIPALRSSEPDAPFQVSFEQAQSAPATKVSDGTTPLYNLWIFQFDPDGNINGTPHHLTDEVTPVNDMATLEVPLVVATNQTLYLLVMGPKLDYDFSGVRTLSELKGISFEYLEEEDSRMQSKITADNEIPFAGSVSGVTIVDIDGGNLGLVEYNTPIGFTGGIKIERLMAKVALRYRFEVDNYTLQGIKLLNVNRKIRLDNPDKNSEADTYATLEQVTDETAKAADGYITCTWYVAQNRWGTVDAIRTESERYYKVDGSTVSGQAPALGTQIEAWAYSKSTANEYAIYQMYVGNNNTNNFDVEANHFYNLRTTINTDIASAKNDQRIRTYAAQQRTEFHASELISGKKDSYNTPGDKYDLDAHFDRRQIIIQTQGQTVNIGIYTDQACTTPAENAPDNWLKVSPSSNYTDAVNNKKQQLASSASATAVLPTQLKFYLYNDEYIQNADGQIPDPDDKRSLFLKISTATTGEGDTAPEVTHIFQIDQRPPVYYGWFGGPRTDDGRSYTMGLVGDQVSEYATVYTDQDKIGYPIGGYYGIDIATPYGADNRDYGKAVTRLLAENPNNLTKDTHFTIPPLKDATGRILLYQYTYYNTFAARYCFDRNRDEDGSGIIEDDEFKWYLPASNQLLAACLTSTVLSTWSATASTKTGDNYSLTNYGGVTSTGRTTTVGVRCVRDIEMPDTSQPGVEIYEDGDVKYAAINTSNMPRRTEDRTKNSDFYVDAALYEYVTSGTSKPMVDSEGNQIYVKRIKRHQNGYNSTSSPDYNVSRRFIVSPTVVYSKGQTDTGSLSTWATGNGYMTTANSNGYNTSSTSATPMGCAMYQGKEGKDPTGTWRVPTRGEGVLMAIYWKELEATNADTGFQPFIFNNNETNYWLATEESGYTSDAYRMQFTIESSSKLQQYRLEGKTNKTNAYYLRCIRDIP